MIVDHAFFMASGSLMAVGSLPWVAVLSAFSCCAVRQKSAYSGLTVPGSFPPATVESVADPEDPQADRSIATTATDRDLLTAGTVPACPFARRVSTVAHPSCTHDYNSAHRPPGEKENQQ